jgi:hypothetical protein
MLLAAVYLLTQGWAPIRRLAAVPIAALFPAALGSLFVGQYDFPVLLGAAWMAYALPRGKAVQIAGAAALLTFKPHLGAPGAIVLIYLLRRRDAASTRLGACGSQRSSCAQSVSASPLWPLIGSVRLRASANLPMHAMQ